MNKLKKYPLIVNSQDLLKFFGIILITLDHVSTFLFYVPAFSILGNVGAPLFFFLAGSHIPKRIFWEYLWLGILITILTRVQIGVWWGNILISFFLIKLVLYYFPRLFTTFWGGLVGLIPLIIHPFNFIYLHHTLFEYGGFGLSYAFSAQVRRHKAIIGTFFCLIVLTCHYAWMHIIDRSSFRLPFDYRTMSFDLTSTADYFHVVLFYSVYVAMALTFILFRMRDFSLPRIIKMPILVVSRYSFHIYAAQLILFRLFCTE